ncbi:MAG: phospho-sugar mutase, partial [Angelakisella sp.]
MDYMKLYDRWAKEKLADTALTEELAAVAGNEKEIEDRFYRDLEFGTGGLRGVLGAGTNRMNIYTIRRATQGLADYLNENFKKPSVAIAYDSRINSELFSRESASVMAANGIKAYIYRELMPTPSLSYAVRELHCNAGINVTASHNPAKYNGFKAYNGDGCQIAGEVADAVMANILKTDIFDGVKYLPFDKGLAEGSIEYIGEDLVQRYISCVLDERINPEVCVGAGLRLVYTPLNGAGRRCVLTVLERMGITDVTVVKEQEMPDGNFPTCPYPNPEITEALQLGLNLTEKLGADLLLATDPDCDR